MHFFLQRILLFFQLQNQFQLPSQYGLSFSEFLYYHLDQLNEPDYDHRAKADLLITESNKLCQAMQTILKQI